MKQEPSNTRIQGMKNSFLGWVKSREFGKNIIGIPGMVWYACNSNTQKAKVSRSRV